MVGLKNVALRGSTAVGRRARRPEIARQAEKDLLSVLTSKQRATAGPQGGGMVLRIAGGKAFGKCRLENDKTGNVASIPG